MTTTDLESILDSELDNVCGGAMSLGEIACRRLGVVAGSAGGFGASIYGATTKSDLVGAAAMVGTGLGSIVAGAANSGNASSYNEAAADKMIGLLGAVPVLGSVAAGYTMGKLGWKAGGAACGYGWNPRS